MAIRVTFSFSGYVAQNLVSSAGVRVANSRCVQECWILSRIFGANQKPDLDRSGGVRNFYSDLRKPKSNCWAKNSSACASAYSTLAGEILGDGCYKNPIILGLISMMKSTAGVSGSSTAAMGIMGISPFKTSSIIPSFRVPSGFLVTSPFPIQQPGRSIKVERERHVLLPITTLLSVETILRGTVGFRGFSALVLKMLRQLSLLLLLVCSLSPYWLNLNPFPLPLCTQLSKWVIAF